MSPEERAANLLDDGSEKMCSHGRALRRQCADCVAEAIRAAEADARQEMLLPCAACAARGEVVTSRMNSELGECPHGYGFDTCTQCHEAFHAGLAAYRIQLAAALRDRAERLNDISEGIAADEACMIAAYIEAGRMP